MRLAPSRTVFPNRFAVGLVLLAAAVTACSDNPAGPGDPQATTIVITVPFDSLFVGASATLQVEVRDQNGSPLTGVPVTWSSSDDEVATVTQQGVVTGVFRGPVSITAAVGEVSDEARFDVVRENVALRELLDGEIEVETNPSGLAPLTAVLEFSTLEPTVASFVVPGTSSEDSIDRDGSEATADHTLPILGLYGGADNQVELRLETEAMVALGTVVISTPELPDFLPSVSVSVADRSSMEPGWTLSSLSIGNAGTFAGYPIIFDRAGDIRWYLDLSGLGGLVFMVEPLANGNLITGRLSTIYEYDMLGNLVNSWDIPGYHYHHDVIEKGPGGNLIIAVNKVGLDTVEDHIIEIDRATGALVMEWDLREILDPTRTTYVDQPDDWFHQNSVWYDPTDGSIVASGRNQTAVVKISADNELVWILGPQKGWGAAWDGFLLTPVDGSGQPYSESVQLGDDGLSEFRWPWGQHAAMYLPNGNLFLFDNGLRRSWTADGPAFSRGVEYEIDEEEMTVRQVWQYGEERGDTYYSEIISDVDYLPQTGHRLIMPGLVQQGTKAFVTEVEHPSGNVVFEAVIELKSALSTGEGFGQIDLVYRSERVPLYPATW